MSTRTEAAPFRADHVGSLLRSARLKDARAHEEKGEITPAELRAIEDEEILKIVRKQESIGLKDATDGEFRRAFWHYDFLEHLDGVESYWGEAATGVQFKGVTLKPGSFYCNPKGNVHGPTLAHEDTVVVEIYDHPISAVLIVVSAAALILVCWPAIGKKREEAFRE